MTPRRCWRVRLVALVVLATIAGGRAAAQEPDTDSPEKAAAIRKSKPFQRWRFALHRRGDLHPFEASRRRAEAQEVLARERARHPEGALSWESLGPAPILGFPVSSGRVSAVAVDPANASHWLIGAAQGGIWSTTDAGATWVPRTDDQPSLSMGAIAFAPGSPNVVYAGTGEAHYSGDSYGGAGVLKSTDGGNTWTLLASATFRGSAFSEIRVDPTNANVAVAAVTYAIAGRYPSYPPNLPPRGLFRTTDGGSTWSLTLAAAEASDIETEPGGFARQYAGLKYTNSYQPGAVARSADGGLSWQTVAGPWSGSSVGRVEIAFAPSNPSRVYVAIDDALGNGLLGVWRTDNAWGTSPAWMPVPNPPCPDWQYWYDFDVSVDPLNADRLYVGGVGLCRYDGTAWTTVTGTLHADQQVLTYSGNRLIVGNDGGVFSTTDSGATWANHNSNLSLTQFYDGALHPTSAAFALGGSQDNGTEKWTGTPAWQQVFGADGGDCEISTTNPQQHWAITTQVLGVWRTRDGGNSFDYAGDGLTGYVPFIGRLAKCPWNDNVMLAGTNPVHKSTDFFGILDPTWAVNGPEFDSTVYALEFAPSDTTCRTYLAGTDWPELMLTQDGGATWRDIRVGPVLPFTRYPVDVAFHPTDANVLYVAFSGFNNSLGIGHLFRTTNALSPTPTWTAVGPPVDVPHNTVVVDPTNPNVVYVGTDVGVWRSADAGASWVPLSGLPNAAVFDLHVNAAGGTVVAFTHGRGAWRLPLASVGFQAPASTADEASGVAIVAARIEGAGGGPLVAPVTVAYATQGGTALSGVDFVPTSGILTFPAGTPSGGTLPLVVPLVDDPTDEPDESFTLHLSSPSGATPGSILTHTVTLADDDAPPFVSAGDAGVVEGNGGSSLARFGVSLSEASAFPIMVAYRTEEGTATPGVDYADSGGVVNFAPGTREASVAVPVFGDLQPEPDEFFRLQLLTPFNATLGDGTGVATILDDDGASLSSRALLRGSRVEDDLAAVGPAPDQDFFHLSQLPLSSYEIVVDAASGDVQPLGLDRVAADGVTVLQFATPIGAGRTWSLRWENSLAQPVDVQYARVRSGGCGLDCGTDDRYRVRMYETTLAGSRFNNSSGQASVLILQNVADAPVSGRQYYWGPTGVLLAARSFSLASRATQVLALAGVPGLAGASGSLTVAHDGAYGTLAGKVVAVEPASGLSFDTTLVERR